MLLEAVRLAAVGMAAYVEPTWAPLARGCFVTAALEIVVETDRIAGPGSYVHSLQFRWHVPRGSTLLTLTFAVFSLALRPLASTRWRRVSRIIKWPLGRTRVRLCGSGSKWNITLGSDMTCVNKESKGRLPSALLWMPSGVSSLILNQAAWSAHNTCETVIFWYPAGGWSADRCFIRYECQVCWASKEARPTKSQAKDRLMNAQCRSRGAWTAHVWSSR